VIQLLRAQLAAVRSDDERGSAIVEFIFVAIVVLIPLVYVVVAVAVVQRSRLSVTNAARDIGRAVAIANSQDEAELNARVALRLALQNQGMSASDAALKYVAASANCDSTAVSPDLAPGSEFAVCVITHQELPAVPSVLSGRGVTLIGRYLVHIDEFRLKAPK
jgi:Flp pilus assembly protein TadG